MTALGVKNLAFPVYSFFLVKITRDGRCFKPFPHVKRPFVFMLVSLISFLKGVKTCS